MNIYTFYENLTPVNHENKLLLELWKKSWAYNGWNPIVLSLEDSKKNPRYQQFYDICNTFPTINQKQYEMICYLRWLAMENKRGWCTDYDVINYSFKPISFGEQTVSATGSMGGSTIYGNEHFYKNVVDTITSYVPDETDVYESDGVFTPHVSDLYIMDKKFKAETVYLVEHRYNTSGYEDAPLVHYANAYIKQSGTTRLTAILKDKRSSIFYESN